jgi:hypothetical protein
VILDRHEPVARRGLDRGRLDVSRLVVGVAGDRDRTILSVPVAIAELAIGLEPPEQREDVVEGPAVVPGARPGIEVRGRSAHGEPRHPSRPANTAHPSQRFGLPPDLGLGLQAPVVGGRKAPPVMQVGSVISAQVRTGFEQQHRPSRLAQSACKHATGRARPDDDHLGLVGSLHHGAQRSAQVGRLVPLP